jgi:hypothetical protein
MRHKTVIEEPVTEPSDAAIAQKTQAQDKDSSKATGASPILYNIALYAMYFITAMIAVALLFFFASLSG